MENKASAFLKYLVGFALGVVATVVLSWGYYTIFIGDDAQDENKEENNVEVASGKEKEVLIYVKSNCDEVKQGKIEEETKELWTFCYIYQEEKSAFDVMSELSIDVDEFYFDYKEYEGIGSMITSIVGYAPDSSKAFWKFVINDEDAQVGVSGYTVEEGDELKFVVDEIQF